MKAEPLRIGDYLQHIVEAIDITPPFSTSR